jgi:hypothetical protein
MEQGHFEKLSHSGAQDIAHLSCNPKFYYHVHTTGTHPEPDVSSLHPHTLFHYGLS